MPVSTTLRTAAITAAALVAITGSPAQAIALPAAVCDTTTSLTLLNFNDFHGRLATSNPDTAKFVGTIEEQRAAAGEANSLLLSAGDSVGATLFASFAANDEPTLELLRAMDVDASAVGNHEFDQGWNDLKNRIVPGVDFPYLGANVYLAGTTTPALPAYTVVEKAGLRVGIIGAVTGELPSLVSPAGIADLTIGDPVAAVNNTIAALKDGNAANGEADVIVVEYHEGALSGTATLEANVAASPEFADIVNNTDARAQVIFNGHTHQVYAYNATTRPIVQAGSYASNVGKVVLNLDAVTGATCSADAGTLLMTSTSTTTLVATYPRVAAAKAIVDAALAQAAIIGNQVIGTATAPITRALTGTSDDRARESTMSNLVAQMFKEVLGPDDPNFIGLQNPGGTRQDFDEGPITYSEAAAILPFANSLMTTQLTGAQVKTVLEQQWQLTAGGTVPGRPYLALGVSKNLTFTYDAARPRLDRITSISVNGKPIDPAKLYTVGSGSFLIAGGDNFHEMAKGVNTRDAGRADLEAWVGWIKDKGTLSPSYAKHGVSLATWPANLKRGVSYTISNIGVPADALALDTLDFKTSAPVNATLQVKVQIAKKRWRTAATATVVNGTVASVTFKVPSWVYPHATVLKLVGPDTKTVIYLPVTVDKKLGT